jgi:ABC-2 type transport system permease protein
MNIFLHELKAYSKNTIIWACALAAVALMFFSMYPAFSKDVAQLKQMLNGMPPAVTKAFNLSASSFLSLLGFYAYMFLYILLCGAIQAMNLGLSVISKEERERTADFLLSKPVTRSRVITSKLLAVLTLLLLTDAFYLVAVRVISMAVTADTYSIKPFLLITLSLLFVQLIFAALGVLLAVAVRRIKSVSSVSLGIVFVFFFINMFGSVIGDKAVRYLTPFKYFDSAYIIRHASYETTFVILTAAIIVLALAASYLIYNKKDIAAA